ncbi:MAG: RNA polymerase sigma factor, partial [Pirellulaceae bacterium]
FAREELYRRYSLRVVFLVRARMGPSLRLKEQSADLAQEALLKSLSGLEKFFYRADGAFVGYLAKKVEEVLCDRVDYWNAAKRDSDRERPLNGTERSGSIVQVAARRRMDDEASPYEVIERHEELELLALALDRLREKNRAYWELVLAIDLESHCLADVAEEHGRSVGAVRKQHDRAKDALARIFARLSGLGVTDLAEETVRAGTP